MENSTCPCPFCLSFRPKNIGWAKITGIMLEKDNEKILKMIEDPDYIAKKVKAAVE